MNETAFLEALSRFAPEVQRAFIAAVQDVTDNVILEQVVQALQDGDAERAWRALGVNQGIWGRFVAAITTAFEYGANATLAAFPRYTTAADGVKTMLRFNMRDRRTEDWLRNHSSELISGIEDDMRVTVRNTLTAGMEAGRNPRSTALDIVGRLDPQTGRREGGVLGLGQREEGWSRAARTRLLTLDEAYFDMALRDKRFDATVRKAIESGKPLPAATVDKLVDRYRARALQYRGEQIGRTETLAAMNQSAYESTLQALKQSDLPLSAGRKIWKTAYDQRVRHNHREMRNVEVAIDEPFVLPDGSRMMHPMDASLGAPASEIVSCRCRVSYQIDFAARLRDG